MLNTLHFFIYIGFVLLHNKKVEDRLRHDVYSIFFSSLLE